MPCIARAGRIFAQLWHTGRVSHPDFLEGELPVAPSAIAPLNEPDFSTFFQGGEQGYTDYPALAG